MTTKHLDVNNLPPDIFLNGIRLTIENASKLFHAANTLKAAKYFGIANSLYILSCEESIKAFALYNKFIIDDDRDISQYFKQHSKKLELLKQGYHFISSETKAMKESFDIATQKLGTIDIEKIENEAKRIHEGVFQRYLNDNSDIEKVNQWWKRQNDTKQKGLYVGFENGEWNSPYSITESDVNVTGEIALNILGHILQYKDLDINLFKTK
jgi:AbiV family abortive infection protein